MLATALSTSYALSFLIPITSCYHHAIDVESEVLGLTACDSVATMLWCL